MYTYVCMRGGPIRANKRLLLTLGRWWTPDRTQTSWSVKQSTLMHMHMHNWIYTFIYIYMAASQIKG